MNLNQYRDRLSEVLQHLSEDERDTVIETTLACMIQELRRKGQTALADKLTKALND